MKKKGLSFTLASLVVALIMVFNILLINKQQVDYVTALPTRTVELKVEQVDYESILNSFDDAVLTQEGSTTYFEGYKSISLSDLEAIDNLSDSEIEDAEGSVVKYNFSYDKESNVVTLAAEMKNELGEICLDEIKGVAFINDQNEIDAVLNVDGESVLLSELREAGLIENCGWFSKLVKKVVKITAAVVITAAVATVVVGLAFATAGAITSVLVMAGVGTCTATVAGGVAGAVLGNYFFSQFGMSAIQAGTAIAEDLGNEMEVLTDKATGAILEIVYKKVSYKTAVLTAAVASTLARNAYFIVFADKNGKMYYSPTAIDRNFAVSIIAANTLTSIYTFKESNARSIAQEAGNNRSPIFESANKVGYFNHYHTYNHGSAHAFFGLPRVK